VVGATATSEYERMAVEAAPLYAGARMEELRRCSTRRRELGGR
jgi:hypothetical protein